MLRIREAGVAVHVQVRHREHMAVTETGPAGARVLDDLYRRHGSEVYRYALAVLGNHADAEDVTQTTFLNAYRSLEQGVHPRKPSNWLLTIASNTIKTRFRQEQTRPRYVELDDKLTRTSTEDEGPTVGEVLTALSRIPPHQRQAIVLREFEGRSYKEIAEILGVTTSALETLLFRARQSLAEELEQHLTCTEAQLAVSRAADGQLNRRERRRLREHLGECPDCARFARLQQRHRRALRGLMLVPVPVSLSLFKGLESSAAAALPALGGGAAAVGASVGAAGATGGGIFAGGLALKAAAVVTAASVAGGVGVVGAAEIDGKGRTPDTARTAKPGKSAMAPGRAVENGRALGKADAPGQARARGGPAPGQIRDKTKSAASAPGRDRARPVEPTRGTAAQAGNEKMVPSGRATGRAKDTDDVKPAPKESPSAKPER
jgi:RNA polymerase sigma-70 factor (ECF subfamily)